MEARSPVRVVLDRALRIRGESRLVHSARKTPLWVMASELADAPAAAKLGAAGAVVIRMPPKAGAGLDLHAVLHTLADKGITRLMVEGGSRVAASFVAADLLDEIWLFRAPQAIGADGINALDALPLTQITQSSGFRVRASEALDQDTLTIYERA
jgi:diaminohydroxyphosphoribosylaminopyrimidine deaminase/5-amino-6-(5-phosphoribosylamino)uracil reductase